MEQNKYFTPNIEDFDELKLLIEKGIELGFFEDVINFKKDEKDNNS